MGTFRQLGDPVCPPCLCQHHGAAYAWAEGMWVSTPETMTYMDIPIGNPITSTQITITERCCVVVNAAVLVWGTHLATDIEIERPLGTIRTSQRDNVILNVYKLMHHAAWEVLDPGTYTYHLVNRGGVAIRMYGAWIKIIASDCEA